MSKEQGKADKSRRGFLKAATAGTAAATFGTVMLDAKEAQARHLRRGIRHRRLRRRRRRAAGGAVLALARQQGDGAGEGGHAGRHLVQGGLLVLGTQQRRHAEGGHSGSKEHFLRYVARLSQPQFFDPNHPRYGLSEWEYSMCEAIYDSSSVGTELLAEKGALPYRHVAPVPDYFAEMETIGATGRVLFPKDGAPSMSDGGQVATRTLSTACRRDGVTIKIEPPRAEGDPQRQGRGDRRRGLER